MQAIACGIAACGRDANNVLSQCARGHELSILITCGRDANDVLCSVSTGIVGERSNKAYLSQRARGHKLRQCKGVTMCINGAVGPGNQRET